MLRKITYLDKLHILPNSKYMLKFTSYEKRWLNLLKLLGFVITGFFLLQPYLADFTHDNQPLADPNSLERLMGGRDLPIPPDESNAEFHDLSALPPSLAHLLKQQPKQVLGATAGNKRIEVDLTNQKVYAYEGNTKVYEFIVSTGRWGQTPKGEFTIWSKVRSQKMSGGSRALRTYYYLPNVPYVMFFYNSEISKARGFSFHGTYWHENFGHPMSHGCVNMRTSDAQLLYDWADPPVTDIKKWSTLADASNPGTRVTIYGTTPKE